jgi:hypothetical protein
VSLENLTKDNEYNVRLFNSLNKKKINAKFEKNQKDVNFEIFLIVGYITMMADT